MFGFHAISLYFEFEESADLADIKDDDVLCIVSVFSCADFYLLEIAEVVVFCTAGEGYACIEEVDEFGTSGKVVLGDWFPGSSLESVGYDDCGGAIFLFKTYESHHEASCGCSFLGVVADECDVVDDKEPGSLHSSFFNGGEDLLFEVGSDDEFRIDLCSCEVGWEYMDFSCADVTITHLELL